MKPAVSCAGDIGGHLLTRITFGALSPQKWHNPSGNFYQIGGIVKNANWDNKSSQERLKLVQQLYITERKSNFQVFPVY